MLTSPQYSSEQHYEHVKKDIKEISQQARIVILLTDIRIAKECLIAAYELNLTQNGESQTPWYPLLTNLWKVFSPK